MRKVKSWNFLNNFTREYNSIFVLPEMYETLDRKNIQYAVTKLAYLDKPLSVWSKPDFNTIRIGRVEETNES